MKNRISLISLLIALALALAAMTGCAFAEGETVEQENPFEHWNPDAPALKALIEYVEAVTDPDSPDFIPEVDRIATYDMDGTL